MFRSLVHAICGLENTIDRERREIDEHSMAVHRLASAVSANTAALDRVAAALEATAQGQTPTSVKWRTGTVVPE